MKHSYLISNSFATAIVRLHLTRTMRAILRSVTRTEPTNVAFVIVMMAFTDANVSAHNSRPPSKDHLLPRHVVPITQLLSIVTIVETAFVAFVHVMRDQIPTKESPGNTVSATTSLVSVTRAKCARDPTMACADVGCASVVQVGVDQHVRVKSPRTRVAFQVSPNFVQDTVNAFVVNASVRLRMKRDILGSIVTDVRLVQDGVKSLRPVFNVRCTKQDHSRKMGYVRHLAHKSLSKVQTKSN